LEGEKGFSFNDILWLLKDKKSFSKIIRILQGRMIYNNDVWSYGFHHKVNSVIYQYLERNKVNLTYYNMSFSEDLIEPSGEYKSMFLFLLIIFRIQAS